MCDIDRDSTLIELLHDEDYADFGEWMDDAIAESKNIYRKRTSAAPALTSRPSFLTQSNPSLVNNERNPIEPSVDSILEMVGAQHVEDDDVSSDDDECST